MLSRAPTRRRAAAARRPPPPGPPTGALLVPAHPPAAQYLPSALPRKPVERRRLSTCSAASSRAPPPRRSMPARLARPRRAASARLVADATPDRQRRRRPVHRADVCPRSTTHGCSPRPPRRRRAAVRRAGAAGPQLALGLDAERPPLRAHVGRDREALDAVTTRPNRPGRIDRRAAADRLRPLDHVPERDAPAARATSAPLPLLRPPLKLQLSRSLPGSSRVLGGGGCCGATRRMGWMESSVLRRAAARRRSPRPHRPLTSRESLQPGRPVRGARRRGRASPTADDNGRRRATAQPAAARQRVTEDAPADGGGAVEARAQAVTSARRRPIALSTSQTMQKWLAGKGRRCPSRGSGGATPTRRSSRTCCRSTASTGGTASASRRRRAARGPADRGRAAAAGAAGAHLGQRRDEAHVGRGCRRRQDGHRARRQARGSRTLLAFEDVHWMDLVAPLRALVGAVDGLLICLTTAAADQRNESRRRRSTRPARAQRRHRAARAAGRRPEGATVRLAADGGRAANSST